MKRLITTAFATMVAVYGYSQDGVHLPLTGGTLTGNLYGVSGVFSGELVSNAGLKALGGGGYAEFRAIPTTYNTTTLELWSNYGNNVQVKALSIYNQNTTLEGSLIGKSATFSGHTAMGGGTNGSTGYGFSTLELRESNFGLNSATPPRLSFHWGGVVASQIGIETSGRIAILNNPGTGYEDFISNNGYFVANATVGSALPSTNVALYLNTVANKAAGIQFQENGSTKWYLGKGAASENEAFELYNSNGQMALSFSKSNSNATFSGNVGVGTTNTDIGNSGDKVLALQGSSVRSTIQLGNTSTGTNGIAGSLKAFNNTTFLGSVDMLADGAINSGAFQFYTVNSGSNIAAMRITSIGNVGIGTTTPTDKLAVNGNIRAKEVKIETNNWPDYVFAPAYNLPDLKSTEQFIKENKHLPEIPSAAEIAKDGVNLGEMNATLLKKIEELTLHLIEQNKRIEILEKKNQK